MKTWHHSPVAQGSHNDRPGRRYNDGDHAAWVGSRGQAAWWVPLQESMLAEPDEDLWRSLGVTYDEGGYPGRIR